MNGGQEQIYCGRSHLGCVSEVLRLRTDPTFWGFCPTFWVLSYLSYFSGFFLLFGFFPYFSYFWHIIYLSGIFIYEIKALESVSEHKTADFLQIFYGASPMHTRYPIVARVLGLAECAREQRYLAYRVDIRCIQRDVRISRLGLESDQRSRVWVMICPSESSSI